MSVTINTYTNSSDDNTLNKSITLVGTGVTAVLKDDTDLINPTLILSGNVSQAFNYVEIEDFNRYYFVTSRTYAQQRYYVQLSVDVLMSFNSEISDLNVIANRSSSNFNLYQKDTQLPRREDDIIVCQNYGGGFGSPTMILAVNGG